MKVDAPALIVKTLPVGQLQTNCYLVADAKTGEAMVVDPGAESERIYAALEKLQAAKASARVKYVVNTHAHFDHVRANGRFDGKTVRGSSDAAPSWWPTPRRCRCWPRGAARRSLAFAWSPARNRTGWSARGDVLRLGAHELQVMHTPGHSPGSISLYCAAENVVFVGDVLFRQGVGRYDLPGGSWAILQESIRSRLFTLPDATTVYPGHGPATTIGGEKKSNPFVR